MFITAVFTSCQKNTLLPEESLSNDSQNTIKPLEASDEMLSFNSEEEMYKAIDRLKMSNNASLKTKATNSNFTSLNDIYKQALAELAEQSENFELANQIKEKYQPYFLYNDNPADDEMYNPYIKTPLDLSYICDRNGNVIINGEVKNFNIADSVQETESYRLKNSMARKVISNEFTENGVCGRGA